MASARLVQLGGFQLDHVSGELSRGGRKVRLPTQSLRILQVLLEHPGELVTRDELRERLWTADTFVDFDAGLNNAVKKLRDALEDSSEHPRFIETIPRRGYRLIALPEVPEPARPRRRILVGVGVLASLAIGGALSLGAARSWLVTGPDSTAPLPRARPVNPDAHNAYLRGRLELKLRTADGLRKAIQSFEEAIKEDPQYAPAYSGLSEAYRFLDLRGVWEPARSMPRAERAAKKALELDGSLAEAHASLAGVLYRHHWSWAAAEQEYLLSIKLDPNYEEGRRAYAIYLQSLRRFDESVAQHRLALSLDPLALMRHVELVAALFRAGKSGEALAEAERVRRTSPPVRPLDTEIAYEHLWRGRNWRAAISAFEKAGYIGGNAWLAFAYARSGRTSDARTMLAALHETAKAQYVAPLRFAIVHFGLGEREEGFQWLEKALDQRAMDLRSLTIGLFSVLHDDPKFQDVLRRMGLAELKEFKTP